MLLITRALIVMHVITSVHTGKCVGANCSNCVSTDPVTGACIATSDLYCYTCSISAEGELSWCPKDSDVASYPGCMFEVDCREQILPKTPIQSIVLDTHDITDTNWYSATQVGSAFDWTDYLSFSNNNCPITWCQLYLLSYDNNINVNTYLSYSYQGHIQTSAFGYVQYSRNRPMRFSLRLGCMNSLNIGYSASISFNIPCHATSTTISSPTADLQSYDLIQGTFHGFTFPKFVTTEPNCNITYQITLQPANTAMASTMTNTYGLGPITAYLSGVPGTDTIPDDYQFTVTATADGGSTFTTPVWTLRTQCGLANSNAILSPASGSSLTFNLPINDPSTVFFEVSDVFNNMVYSCPLTNVMYESSPGVASDLYLSSSSASPIAGSTTTYRAYPADVTVFGSRPFTFAVTFLGGNIIRYSYTINFGCSITSQTLTYNPICSYGNSLSLYTVLLDSYAGTFTISFPKFEESYLLDCRITGYEVLDTNFNPYVGLSITTYDAISKEYTMDISTSLLVTHFFHIRATAFGGAQLISPRIEFGVVCGSETITLAPAPTELLVFSRRIVQVHDIISKWGSLYITDKTQCPVQQYTLFKDASQTSFHGPFDQFVIIRDTVSQFLQNKLPIEPYQGTFYLKGFTSSQIKGALLPINFVVCGFETLKVRSGTSHLIVNDLVAIDTFVHLTNEQLESFFEFDVGLKSDIQCSGQIYELFFDENCTVPWTETFKAELVVDPGTSQIVLHVHDNTPFKLTTVYLKKTTEGLLWDVKQIRIETCGTEYLMISDASFKQLNVTYFESRGEFGTYRGASYMSNIQSSSVNCPVTAVSLWSQDDGVYTSYQDSDVVIDSSSGDIQVSKNQKMQKILYIQFVTRGNQVEYIPLKITIMPILLLSSLEDLLNQPPEVPSQNQDISQEVDLDLTEISLRIPLSEAKDDVQLSKMIVRSNFGTMIFSYPQGSSTPVLLTSSSKTLEYDKQSNMIILTTNDFSGLVGLNTFSVFVTDSGNKTSTYSINLNLIQKERQEKKTKQKDIHQDNLNYTGPICSARIEDINTVGLVTVRFSTPMKTEFINITRINSTFLDLYIEPKDDWHLQNQNFSMENLNFTWNITEYKNDSMLIKLSFFNPYAISPLTIYDKLVLHIKENAINEQFFISETLLKDLHANYTTLREKVPKQMKDGRITQILVGAANNSKLMMNSSVISTIVINIFISISLQFFVAMLNSLQLVFHLPIMSVIVPGNVMTMFQIMIPVVMFDILEALEVFEGYFPESKFDMSNDDLLLDQLRELKYDSYNPILNLGTFIFLIAFYIIRVIFFALIMMPLFYKLKWIAGQTYFGMKNQLFFSQILLLFIEGYMEYLIATRLFTVMPASSVDNTVLTKSTVGICMAISGLILPVLYVWILFQPEQVLRKQKQFKQKWQVLYEEIKPNSKIALLYNVFFIIRRIIYIEIGFSLNEHPCQQLQVLLLMNGLSNIYLGKVRPFIQSKLNNTELINDVFLYIITFHFFLFTDFVPEAQTQYNIGFSCILFVFFSIIFNIINVFRVIAHGGKLLTKKYYNQIDAYATKIKNQNTKRKQIQEQKKKMLEKLKEALAKMVAEQKAKKWEYIQIDPKTGKAFWKNKYNDAHKEGTSIAQLTDFGLKSHQIGTKEYHEIKKMGNPQTEEESKRFMELLRILHGYEAPQLTYKAPLKFSDLAQIQAQKHPKNLAEKHLQNIKLSPTNQPKYQDDRFGQIKPILNEDAFKPIKIDHLKDKIASGFKGYVKTQEELELDVINNMFKIQEQNELKQIHNIKNEKLRNNQLEIYYQQRAKKQKLGVTPKFGLQNY